MKDSLWATFPVAAYVCLGSREADLAEEELSDALHRRRFARSPYLEAWYKVDCQHSFM